MRIGVSSRGRWWVSMGPLGWLLFGWIYLCVLAAVGVGFVVWFLLRTLGELLWLVTSSVRRA